MVALLRAIEFVEDAAPVRPAECPRLRRGFAGRRMSFSRKLLIDIVVPAGAYFAALSRRLNSTCSNSTASSSSIGRSAASSSETLCRTRILLARRNALPTISPISCRAVFGTMAPDSSLVMSSRFAMNRLSRSDSSITVASKSRFSASVSSLERSRIVLAAPRTDASGVLRSCEIEVSSAERNRSDLHGTLHPVHVLNEQHALDRKRALVHQRIEQPPLVRRKQRSGPVVVDADDADRSASGSHRQEQPLGARQRVRAAPGRAIVAPCPVRGGKIGLVELILGRIARLHGDNAILGQQQHDPHFQHQRGLVGGRPQHIIERRRARELAAEGVKRFRRPRPCRSRRRPACARARRHWKPGSRSA